LRRALIHFSAKSKGFKRLQNGCSQDICLSTFCAPTKYYTVTFLHSLSSYPNNDMFQLRPGFFFCILVFIFDSPFYFCRVDRSWLELVQSCSELIGVDLVRIKVERSGSEWIGVDQSGQWIRVDRSNSVFIRLLSDSDPT
jgi:hypothetical protein